MSSFWDSIGQALENDSLTFERVKDLVDFLKEMDIANNNVTSIFLKNYLIPGYKFIDYDTLLYDIQNKGVSKHSLEWIFSDLHDFDHINSEIIMYSYSRDKHYWLKHRLYRSVVSGTFKDGKWNEPRKQNPDKKQRLLKERISTVEEDFKILSDAYDTVAKLFYTGITGYVPIAIDVTKIRKYLWEHYRINKYQFTKMVQKIMDYDRESLEQNRIKLSGGPCGHYHKDNWIEYNGKHYLGIEVETEEHKKQMIPHR